jgi:alpha-galactosidase
VRLLPCIPLLLSLLPACGGGSGSTGTGNPPAACTSGRAKDGTFTLAFPSRCVTGVTLRVRSGGSFRDATAADTLDVTDAGGGALHVVASAAPPVEAFEIVLPGVPGDTILQQGYQSWGYSGLAKIPATVPLGADGALALGAAEAGDPVQETAGVSYGSAVVGTKGGPVFVAGAVSAARATTGVAAKAGASGHDADVTLLYGALREPLPAGADGKVHSEALHLAFADSTADGLAPLTAAMGAAMPAARSPARPPGGWFSWNEHFAAVDEALVEANADVVASQLASHGMKLVEIDDGWERAWGDWQAGASFPSGMAAAASYVTGKGLVAGVWMAPFLVDVTSATATSADPELFVQAAGGGPLVHTPSGGTRQCYVLDGTSDASMAVAADAIKALYTAGFRYFKLDFLYAGALVGARSAAGATGNQALAAGLAKLRAAAGEDAIIDACGAPILPVLGWADALRVGSDTAIDGVDLKWPFVTSAARSVGARAYLFPLVWPDADQAQLRSPYTADEASAAAAVAALAGPAYALGDDLTTLDPARLALALDPALLDVAAAAQPGTPADAFDAPAPDVVPVTPVLDFSGATPSAPPPASFTAQGKSGARYTITFSWDAPHGVTIAEKP